MKRIVFVLLLSAFCAVAMAQEEKSARELRKEEKQRKKAEREAKEQELYLAVGKMLNDKRFTLQATFLKNRQGARISVNPTLNFIQVTGDKAFVQIGDPSIAGYNAAGGISAEGMITKWKLEKSDKRKTYDLYMTVLLNFGSIDVFMDINMNSYAMATISGFSSAQLTYDGGLVSTADSDVQKGWTP